MSYVRAWIEIARLLDRESSQPAIAPTPRGPRARRKGLQPTISSPRAPKLYGNGADRRDEPPPGAANHESDQSDRGVLRVERAHDHEPNRRFRSGESSHFRRYVHPAETRLLVARAFARPSRSPAARYLWTATMETIAPTLSQTIKVPPFRNLYQSGEVRRDDHGGLVPSSE